MEIDVYKRQPSSGSATAAKNAERRDKPPGHKMQKGGGGPRPAAPFLCNWGYFHMVSWFLALPHTAQALLATLFTWGVTALGAGLVFFFRTMNKNALDAMLGFAAGVMTAASFWSPVSYTHLDVYKRQL